MHSQRPSAALDALLTALPTLRAFQMDEPEALPLCLPRLTNLRRLELNADADLSQAELDGLQAALTTLTDLTCLVSRSAWRCRLALPPMHPADD